MSRYLLSPRSILDRISGKQHSIDDFLYDQPRDSTDIYVSWISIGLVRSSIEQADNPTVRTQFGAALDKTLRFFPPKSILSVDEKTVEPWVNLIAEPSGYHRYKNRSDHDTTEMLSDAELLVVATALAKKLTLIEPKQPYHEVLSTSVGLKVETLGE